MKLDKNQRIIITRKQGAELFLILSQARLRLTTKYRTSAERYWKEFEKILGLSTEEE